MQDDSLYNERAKITKAAVDQIERDILIRRHIERYMGLRQFAYGTVLDCACGTDYGSYLLSRSDDVQHVYGFDLNEEAVQAAKTDFQSEKITYQVSDLADITQSADVLVSFETIEHLEDPTLLADLCDRCDIEEILLSFPAKKSTHYNKFHKWDLVPQDIRDIFPKFVVLEQSEFAFDSYLMRLARHERVAIAPRRWNRS